MTRSLAAVLALATFGSFGAVLAQPAAVLADQPSVAVLSFSSEGLDSTAWWDSSFKPGDALGDLVTDQIVNKNQYTVVDRQHLGQIMQEHQLSASGEVSPATAIQAGRLIGAKFLITGRIVQFQKTANNAAQVGGFISHALGGGNVSGDKVNLNVAVHVIDATSGRIVQAFNVEDTKTGTSFGVGTGAWAGAGGGYGSYQSTQFVESTMGKLINEESAKIADMLDPSKMVAGPAAPQVSGKVVGISDADIILNIGSSKGVQVGQFFDVMKVVTMKDPDSGQMITTKVPKGKIQITSVDTNSSVGHKVGPGTIAVGSAVSAE